MDCRRFRKNHTAFVDGTLPGISMDAMRAHVARCAPCARQDARTRRALLVARNAPLVEPSPEFRRRLAARLAAERLRTPFRTRRPLRAVWWSLAAAASFAFVVGASSLGLDAFGQRATRTVSMAPVLVTPPALPAEPVSAPAMFATVSSSLPVYPAVLMAQRASEQFAETHERAVTFQAQH